MEDKLEKLNSILKKVHNLRYTSALLEWDQQVNMPQDGIEERGEQIATISELAHNLFVSEEVGQLLNDLQPYADSLENDSDERRLIKVTRRHFDQETKIPVKLLMDLSQATTNAFPYWEKAKESNNFTIFAPYLEKIIDLTREMANCFQPFDHIYDPLLNNYEPGMKTADVKRIFSELRPLQVDLIQWIANRPQIDDSFLHQYFDPQKQLQFGVEIAQAFGMDWSRSRQDKSAHPFTTSFGQKDVRITTKVKENLFTSSLFSTMHESGHALYELGFDPSYRQTLLSEAASLAIHESQSRMWENIIGRSRPFWQHFYPKLMALFPEQLHDVSVEKFYRAINMVEPSFIRTEADEATYNLHIMLRLELEIELMEDTLQVKDLPDAWNSRMNDYLGIVPATDSIGVLQDVHWSAGLIGYFPTYALGNLISVQLWDKMQLDIPTLNYQIENGDFHQVLGWLRENIHRYGAKYEPQELVQRITGSMINSEPYVRYLQTKYQDIYE